MSKRLEVLEASLAKKESAFDSRLADHFACVKSANGQPLNDKRNGHATLRKWEKQNDALRKVQAGIEATKSAIEREKAKIKNVQSVTLPPPILELIDAGKLTQWRKHPTFFFVTGVEKARIHLLENGTIAHRYLSEIPDKEQYAIFRDVFNELNRKMKGDNA